MTIQHTTQKKGPAEAATSPSHGSNPTPTGKIMNAKSDSTVRMLKEELEHTYGEISDLLHMLHFLESNLEESLDFKRGVEAKGSNAVKLMFDKDGISATQWLAGSAWLKARKLRDHLEGVFDAMVEKEERAAA